MNQTKFANSVLMIVIVVIVAVGGYVVFVKKSSIVQQSTLTTPKDEIANWQTFTDTKYGFSFRYPMDWNVRSFVDTKNSVATFSVSDLNVKRLLEVSGNFTPAYLQVIIRTIDVSLDDWTKSHFGAGHSDIKKTSFAGVPAYRAVAGGTTYRDEIYFKKADQLYVISMDDFQIGGDENVKAAVAAIAHSFQFVQ